jgi:hypothetical protein
MSRSRPAQENGPRIRSVLAAGRGHVDLYRTITAGPSGQRSDLLVGRVQYLEHGPDEFAIVDVTSPHNWGETAGYARRTPYGEWSITETLHNGQTRWLGYASTLSVGVDALFNGRHAALGRHDAQRISRGYLRKGPEDPAAGATPTVPDSDTTATEHAVLRVLDEQHDHAAHAAPGAWQETVDMVLAAVRAAATASNPDAAAAQVGWTAGWHRGAPAGVHQAAARVLSELDKRRQGLSRWADRIQATRDGQQGQSQVEQDLARATRGLSDVDTLRPIVAGLLRDPTPQRLLPTAPPMPAPLLSDLRDATRDVDDPAARLVGLTATAWQVGSRAGRAAGTVTAVNDLASNAAARRIRHMAAPDAATLVPLREWVARSLTPARAYLTLVLGERAAQDCGLLSPPPAPAARAFPQRPNPAPGANPGCDTSQVPPTARHSRAR